MAAISVNIDPVHEKAVLSWIEGRKNKLDDMTPLRKQFRDIIETTAGHEFTTANPNNWKPLSEDYRQAKIAMGYPDIIGVRTGGLKFAATRGAELNIDKGLITWKVDMSHVNPEGETVGDYAIDFHLQRPVFKYSKKYLKTLLRSVVERWVRKNVSEE